jgi:hypothetical protein
MRDIVERLRIAAPHILARPGDTMREAADEIERLRADNARMTPFARDMITIDPPATIYSPEWQRDRW